jgi:hypothetical protein
MSRTNDRRQKTERLDIAIDRAVREMLDVEPPAGLRGRAIARIERPRRSVGWMWIAAPVAAAAVIVLAVLAPWRDATPVAPPSIAKVVPAVIIPLVASKTPESPKTISIPLPFSPAPRRAEHMVVAASVQANDTSDEIAPLSPIALLNVSSVRPANITQTEIGVGPLAPITELQVAPLSPPDRRN